MATLDISSQAYNQKVQSVYFYLLGLFWYEFKFVAWIEYSEDFDVFCFHVILISISIGLADEWKLETRMSFYINKRIQEQTETEAEVV